MTNAIGDCNHDGYVNNYDIDCMVDLLAQDPYCGPDFYTPCGVSCEEPEESARFGGTPDECEHFWGVVAWLYEHFEMD